MYYTIYHGYDLKKKLLLNVINKTITFMSFTSLWPPPLGTGQGDNKQFLIVNLPIPKTLLHSLILE